MWYVIRTQVNPTPKYIKTTGYPYIASSVMYCGESKAEAINVYDEVCADIVENRGSVVYSHNSMSFMNSADAYFSGKPKGQPFYYKVAIYKD